MNKNSCTIKATVSFCVNVSLFESRGIPYYHVLCTNINSIPSILICKRRRRDAKSDYICSIPAKETDADNLSMIHFGALVSACVGFVI